MQQVRCAGKSCSIVHVSCIPSAGCCDVVRPKLAVDVVMVHTIVFGCKVSKPRCMAIHLSMQRELSVLDVEEETFHKANMLCDTSTA